VRPKKQPKISTCRHYVGTVAAFPAYTLPTCPMAGRRFLEVCLRDVGDSERLLALVVG